MLAHIAVAQHGFQQVAAPQAGNAQVARFVLAQVFAEADVVDIALAVAGVEGHTQGRILAHRQIDKAFRGQAAEALRAGLEAAAQGLRVRLVGVQVDGAGESVAAVQRALRAFQHFDALDIEVGLGLLRRARAVYAVEEETGDGGVIGKSVVGVGAAHGHLGVRADKAVAHAGGDQLQAGNVGDARALHGALVQSGDRDADILQVLLALLRGDDDFFQDKALRQRRAGQRAGQGQRQAGATNGNRACFTGCCGHCGVPLRGVRYRWAL